MALKAAIAVPQQNAHCIAGGIGDCKVQFSVTVEVSDHDAFGRTSCNVIHLGAEAAIALAEQHADRAAGGVRYGEIKVSVAIEVPNGHGLGIRARRVLRRLQKLSRMGRESGGEHKKHKF